MGLLNGILVINIIERYLELDLPKKNSKKIVT